jgi:hypothetical protein
VKSEDYAYWSGRLSVALRALLENPEDLRVKMAALATLSGYELLTADAGGEVISIEGRSIELPYPESPLASRKVDE